METQGFGGFVPLPRRCSGWNAERQWRLSSVGCKGFGGLVAAVGTPKGNGDVVAGFVDAQADFVAAVGTPKGNGDKRPSTAALLCGEVAAVGTPKGNGDFP